MRIIKAWTFIVFTILIIFASSSMVFALSPAAGVSGNDVLLGSGNSITVPVNIDNNPGLMGFKISVEFPRNIVSIESVDQGDVTKTGNFSTKTDSDGKITILWNNTFQVLDNGTLFILKFAVLDDSTNGKVSFSFSEEDTFNEQYENVPIRFNEIHLIASKDAEPKESNQGMDASPSAATTGNEQKAKIDTSVNEQTNPITDNSANEQKTKINDAITEIEKNFSDSEIKSIIDNSLKEINTPSIDEIPPDKKEAFAEDVREQLYIDGVEKVQDLNDDELISALEKVVGIESKVESDEKSDGKGRITVIMTIALVVLIVSAITVVIVKNKNKSK